MLSQNQVLLIISHTDRVQLITGVQVQELLQDRTVHQRQVQEITEAVRRFEAVAAVAEAIAAAEAAAEAAAVLIPEDQAEVLQEAAGVHQEVVLHLPVVVNF